MTYRTKSRGRPWTLARIAGGVRRYGPIAVADFLLVSATYGAAIALRTGSPGQVLEAQVAPFSLGVVLGAGALQVASNLLFAVYWRDWSAAALDDMIAIVQASGLVVIA